MTSVRGLPHSIHATDISPLSNTIAFGGADGMVKIMKIAEVEDKTEVFSLNFDPDEKFMAAGRRVAR